MRKLRARGYCLERDKDKVAAQTQRQAVGLAAVVQLRRLGKEAHSIPSQEQRKKKKIKEEGKEKEKEKKEREKNEKERKEKQ